jgi:2-polyprenyl-3-methyl-5-hydroxy-6-metoxy-1,4-benzoquinol methylase
MMAFAEHGAIVHGSDLNTEHNWPGLRRFLKDQGWVSEIQHGDCQSSPWNGQYDVVLALDLIEHIPNPHALAAEIKRLLAPGGIAILTTPPKLLSIFWGEPHWQMKGLSLLPFRLQAPIAKLLGRKYPYPIHRQYSHAGQIAKLFSGFEARAVAASEKLPLPQLFWKFIQIRRPL